MENKKIALVSEKLPVKLRELFGFLGYGCVLLPKHDILDTPVASHPDMLFSVLSDGTLLCDGAYYEGNKPLLEGLGARFCISERTLGKRYPSDVLFDALIFDETVYGKLEFIAPEILKSSKKTVSVKQGYTLCSTLVTDRCAITADVGIYDALFENGVSVLKIAPDGIDLDGYGCGFIGGASAFDKESDTVIFFGDVTKHKSYREINDFLAQNGHKLLYTECEPLSDYGGAKLISF